MSMLTVAKLDIYRHYAGDIDGWTRHARDDMRAGIDGADWRLIDELLLGLGLVARGQASPAYARALEQRIVAVTADATTRAALSALADWLRPADVSCDAATRHQVWRQDDNGNVFLVASFDCRGDAEREIARLAGGGHKQLYWITAAPPSGGRDQPPGSRSEGGSDDPATDV